MTSRFLGYHNIMFVRSQNKDFSLKGILGCNREGNLRDISYSKRKYCACKMLGILNKTKKILKPVKWETSFWARHLWWLTC